MNSCLSSSQLEVLLRRIAGLFVLIAVFLTYYHSPNWIFFLGFIGLNLLQSSFSGWCPMMTILRKGFKVQG
jgi:hypothetical protein